LILFIGNERGDLAIKNWNRYFFGPDRDEGGFWVELDKKRTFSQLGDDAVRELREYAIPTIEITMDDSTTLDEIINLFVDINQQGVAVDRFEIVKAMNLNNPLLKDVFSLLARQEKRGEDVFYKAVNNDFTDVLKRMNIVENLYDANSKVDRMWERLLEIALFCRARKHRKPVEILKSFVANRDSNENNQPKLSKDEKRYLRHVFEFLSRAYKHKIRSMRLATDQTHFYTMITALIDSDLMQRFDDSTLIKKLAHLGKLIDQDVIALKSRNVATSLKRYLELSVKQTTDVSRRGERQALFVELVASL
jgi:hypothetical protein